MGSSSEQLYLLEVLVDKIQIPNNDNFNISVKVVFGDVGTFVISHEGSRQVPGAIPDNPSRIEFSTGKSLLFPMRPTVLLSEFDTSPLAIYIIHENDNIGFTIIQWDSSFYQTVEQSRMDHNETIAPNLVKKSFVLKHPIVTDIIVGEITLLIRLSCLGTNIMTQFQLVPGLNEKESSFVFKPNSGSSMVNSRKAPSNVLSSSTDAVPVQPMYSDVLDSTQADPDTSLQDAGSLRIPENSIQDESIEQSEAPPMPSDNSVEKTSLKADEIVPKKIKGPCGNSECPIAMKIKKFLDSNPVGFEPNKSFNNSLSEVSKEEKEEIQSTNSLPLTNRSFTTELTDINNLFPFPPTRKYEPLTYFAQKCYGNCTPGLCGKDMVHTPYCPARKHVPSCALSDKGSRCKLCPECGGYTESGKTCLEHTMKASTKMSPDFKPTNTAEDNVQEVYKCELPRKTEPVRNCHVNRLPGYLFTCQGGGCKKVVKKMECVSAPESTPREPCYPVPHCMQYSFNPCERPKCLKDMPRSHFPCFMPPCLAGQPVPAKSKKSKRGRSRSIPEGSQGNPDGTAKRKKKRKKCDAKCPVRMKMFYERINLKAHKTCDEEAGRIPANMGWRWNGHPDFSEKVNNGWRPGAVPKKVYEIMSKFKSTNEESPEEVEAKFKEKKEKAIQAAESRATLQVSKKDNTVTVNFLTLPPELNAAGINISEFNPLTFEIMDDGQLKRTSSVISKSVLKKDLNDAEGNMYFNVQSALTDMCELLKNSTIVEPFKTLSDQEASQKDTHDITLVRKGSMAKELEECKSVFNIKMTPRKLLQKKPSVEPATKITDTQLPTNGANYEEIKLQVPRVVDRLPGTQTINKKPIVTPSTYRNKRPGTSHVQRLTSPRTVKETMDNIAKQTKTVKK